MANSPEKDYVLGTHDEEIMRLGLQHRVWRPYMLKAFQRAHISTGSKVLDVGAGPGYATIDLGEITGPSGSVYGLERSSRFLDFAKTNVIGRGLHHVRFAEMDLMTDDWKADNFDAVWCRWVASFVLSPELLVTKIAAALKPGGCAIFHEYADYGTWRFAPRRPALEDFVRRVTTSWRESGGEPDAALQLPSLLSRSGFKIRHMQPLVFSTMPCDFLWQWPAAFIKSNANRLLELAKVNASWVRDVQQEFAAAEADPTTLMITPMVLEIIAEL